jgi:hypothetical protein
LEEISREVGVSTDTLERWRAESLATPARERAWPAAARLNAVITTAAMDESTRSAWCRENGVYPQELDAWRTCSFDGSPIGLLQLQLGRLQTAFDIREVMPEPIAFGSDVQLKGLPVKQVLLSRHRQPEHEGRA